MVKAKTFVKTFFLFIHTYIVLFVVVDYTCFADSKTSAASWDGRCDLHCCSYWTDWVKNIFLFLSCSVVLRSGQRWRFDERKINIFLREFPAIKPKEVKYQDLNNRTIKVSFLVCAFARLCRAKRKILSLQFLQKNKRKYFSISAVKTKEWSKQQINSIKG